MLKTPELRSLVSTGFLSKGRALRRQPSPTVQEEDVTPVTPTDSTRFAPERLRLP